MKRKCIFKLLAVCMLFVYGIVYASAGEPKLTVYAAASTTGPLLEIAKLYKKKTGMEVNYSFASSGVLARQLEQGAPASVYISASKKWADYVEKAGLIKDGTRYNFLANTLVLISPKDSKEPTKIEFDKSFKFAELLKGRLSIGNPEHVPAGKYAKQALTALGWWDGLSKKMIFGKDVRTALRVVEVGEAEYGIVYGSDSLKSDKVETVGIFPESTHKPIVYVVTAVKGSGEEADKFIDYLFSPEVSKIFESFGFIPKEK